MATSESVSDGSERDCGRRSRVAVVFACDARFTEGRSRASFSLRKLGFGLYHHPRQQHPDQVQRSVLEKYWEQ